MYTDITNAPSSALRHPLMAITAFLVRLEFFSHPGCSDLCCSD